MRRKLPKMSKDEAQKLYDNLFTTYAIAEKYGVSQAAVWFWLHDLGVKTHSSVVNKNFPNKLVGMEKEIIELYVEGYGAHRISKFYNVSRQSILHLLKCNDVEMRDRIYGLQHQIYDPERGQNAKLRSKRGKDSALWKGGREFMLMIRDALKDWRKSVFERDKYQCIKCNSKNLICVHHVVELRNIKESVINETNLDINNDDDKIKIVKIIVERHTIDIGITLCERCHINIHDGEYHNINHLAYKKYMWCKTGRACPPGYKKGQIF